MPLPENLLVCRLCVKTGSFADIFEVNGSLEIRVADVINELLDLNVSPGDGLPDIICCSCLNELARFKRFKNISHEAKTTLECIIKENSNVLPNSLSSSTTGEENVVEIVDLVENDDSEDESSGAETVAAPSPVSNEGECKMDTEDNQEDDDCKVVCVPSVITSCDAKETSVSSVCRNDQSSSSKTTAVYLPVAKELVRKEEEDAGMVVAKDPLSVDEDEFPSGNGPKSDDLIDVKYALIKSELMESEIEDPLALPSSSKTTAVYLPEEKELVRNETNAKIGGTKDPLNMEGDNVSLESDFESDDESIVNVDDDEADIVELDIEGPLGGINEPEHCSRTLGYVRASKGATVNAASSNQPMQADKDEVEETSHNFRSSTVSLSESSDEEVSGCENILLQCSLCEKTFDNDLEFQAHIEKIVCQKNQCDDCLKSFSSEVNLKKHKKICQMSKIYLCQICKKTFKDALSLKGHVLNHSKLTNTYTCKKCSATFTRKRDFEKHCKQCTIPEMVSSEEAVSYYKCGACKNSYKGYYGFIKHYTGHTGKVAAICGVCNLSFKCGTDLRRHVSDEHGLLECNFCSKKFMESYYLNRHMLTHSYVRPFYCNLCGNNYKTQYTLDVHLLNAHRS